MNKEHSEQLYREFPELYRGRTKPMTENLMCFGFSCGDGWYELIRELSAAIMAVCQREGIEVPEVVQVKEKFGALRYYLHTSGGLGDQPSEGNKEAYREIYKLIDEAEARSETICEVCGEPGKWRDGLRWIRTLCERHYATAKKGLPLL